MAKLSSIQKNINREKMVRKYFNQRLRLKNIILNKDENVTDDERFEAQCKLSKLPRNSSKVRLRNRCKLTGRPRGFYRKFKLSRIALRDLAALGLIPGMTKSSW